VTIKAGGGGVILNIIGNGGENFHLRHVGASAGNAALMAFTRAFGGRSFDDGIRVVGVNPGPVAADRIVKIMRPAQSNDAPYTELLAAYSLGRAATVREVADLFAFLAFPRRRSHVPPLGLRAFDPSARERTNDHRHIRRISFYPHRPPC
jgi:NAD(P)-dependent dehydrogenase (short-subunit alcohol dehydrogenase family)